jgi:hypothetical protein
MRTSGCAVTMTMTAMTMIGGTMTMTLRTRTDLIEALAAIEHQRWSDWQQLMHHTVGYLVPEDDLTMLRAGDLVISVEQVDRWERQIATPYADLTDAEQHSDREQVMRYWPLLVDFVAQWLETAPDDGHRPALRTLAAGWRASMSNNQEDHNDHGRSGEAAR